MRRSITLISLAAVGLLTALVVAADTAKSEDKSVPDVLKFNMKSLAGEDVDLAKYQGKVILMINVASHCGFTPQYEDLEAIYKKYQDKGFVILGFPANNFGEQELGTDAEIAQFCKANYGVTFPMFSKISVLDPDKAPLYKYLTAQSQTTTKETGEVKWNFEKFLIGKDGKIVGRYRSATKPTDPKFITALETELAK